MTDHKFLTFIKQQMWLQYTKVVAKEKPKNYRPVALTSHVIKASEKEVRKIIEFLQKDWKS